MDAERAWDMALWSFRESTRTITEMAQEPKYRARAVADVKHLNDAVLAINLMWSELIRQNQRVA